MQPQRVFRVRVVDDASALVITYGEVIVHTPTMKQSNEYALSLGECRKEGGDSYSLVVDTSPQKSKSFYLGKEKIKALRGLDMRSSVSKAKNLSGSKTKPNSITKQPAPRANPTV